MYRLLKLVLLGALVFTQAIVLAEDPAPAAPAAPKSPWDGSNASTGFTMNTGNTVSKNLNASLNVQYKKERWTNTSNAGLQWQTSSGVTSKDKYTFTNQTNYSFSQSQKSFVFMNVNLTIDHFSPYNYVFVGSSGYGRDIVKTPTFLLSAQLGPGYRRNKQRDDDLINNHFVLASQGNMSWNITKAGTLTEMARFDWGQPFDYFQTVTAFTNKIIGNLAMQASFELDYTSSIPPSSSQTRKTDTITSLSLVYNF
jgi:putative salt-induced outer membrane protein